jgi:hypothetical protein
MAGMVFNLPIIGIPGVGIIAAPLFAFTAGFFTLDRGDQVQGLYWLIPRVLGTLIKEREERRDPYVIKRGYAVPGWLGGKRLPEEIAELPGINLVLVPAVWDDYVDGAAIIQAIAKSKAELGAESAEK